MLLVRSTFLLGRSTFLLGRSTLLLVRSTFLLGRSTFLLGRSTLILGRSSLLVRFLVRFYFHLGHFFLCLHNLLVCFTLSNRWKKGSRRGYRLQHINTEANEKVRSGQERAAACIACVAEQLTPSTPAEMRACSLSSADAVDDDLPGGEDAGSPLAMLAACCFRNAACSGAFCSLRASAFFFSSS